MKTILRRIATELTDLVNTPESVEHYERWGAFDPETGALLGEFKIAIGRKGRRKRLGTYISNAFVAPEHRGKGIASNCYRELASEYGELRSDVASARSVDANRLWLRLADERSVDEKTGQFVLRG